MPTVLQIDGLRVVIYPNDHRPAHVHVIGNGCEAVFDLCCPGGPPTLRENYGFARRKVTWIRGALGLHLAALCDDWRRIHGWP
jgi:hypothetical protein